VVADELHGLRQSAAMGKLDLLPPGPLRDIKTVRVAGSGPVSADVATDRTTIPLGRRGDQAGLSRRPSYRLPLLDREHVAHGVGESSCTCETTAAYYRSHFILMGAGLDTRRQDSLDGPYIGPEEASATLPVPSAFA
jgi:hypothetical protein